MLNSSGGVEKKLDANSKRPPVSCWEKLACCRPGKREDSTEGSKLYLVDVKGAGSTIPSVGVLSFAVTEKDESRRTLVMTQGNTAVTLDGVT